MGNFNDRIPKIFVFGENIYLVWFGIENVVNCVIYRHKIVLTTAVLVLKNYCRKLRGGETLAATNFDI